MKQRNKGQIFLLSMLVLSTVLTASVLLSSIFIRDIKLSMGITNSVQAFYIADSVAEAQLYKKFKNIDLTPSFTETFLKDINYNYNFFTSVDSNCSVGVTECIKAVGEVGQVSRGLEIGF